MIRPKARILFTGYAPVHFVCFQPLYERLLAGGDIEVYVSGGLRTKTDAGWSYDIKGLYRRFGLPTEALKPVDEIADMDFDYLFCANTNRIEPRSVHKRVQIFHGMSFRNCAVREANDGADNYFVIGPYMRRAFQNRGIFEEGDPRALEIGFMKTDRLRNGALRARDVLKRYGFRGNRPVVLFAPTGQKGNSMEKCGEELLSRLFLEDRYDILLKLHDHPKDGIDWFERLRPLEGEHFRLARGADVIPPLYAADILVSDASSVSNEYALLDRPMVFIDVPELIEASASKGALDLHTWGRRAGDIVADANEACDAIAKNLAEPHRNSQIRRAMVADLFYNPGRATPAAAAWLDREMALV